MSKLRQRLQKMATVQSVVIKSYEILDEEIDNTLKEVMKETAKDIDVPYDDEIFNIAKNNTQYIDVKNNLDMLLDTIQKIAEEWKQGQKKVVENKK